MLYPHLQPPSHKKIPSIKPNTYICIRQINRCSGDNDTIPFSGTHSFPYPHPLLPSTLTMVLPSLYSSDSGGNLSSSNSISSTSKKDQTFLLRKLSLWYRTYNSRSRFYRLTVGGLFFILVWLTICIIWRKIALDYELQRGAVLFRNLYPAPPSESSLGTKTTFPSSSSSPSSSVISPDLPIIPILIPVYSRPEYLQRVITSLKNVHNINQVSIYTFFFDDSQGEML